MAIDPAVAPATEIAAAIRRRDVSSEEVLDALLRRVEAVNPAVNAVVTIDERRARAACRAADAATIAAADEPGAWSALGPLHGVPITIKDVWETEGLRTTCGAPVLADHVPDRDALAVARLKRGGAVVFGKTNVPIWAGDVQTDNEVFGLTRNPWNLDRTAGGSSGGAAVALATGMTPLELGSDIGGSIRTPSSHCGVYGLKPTWGIVPSRGHIPGPPGSLVDPDVNAGGPMARSVHDLEVALDLIAGPTPEDAVAWRLDLPSEIEGHWSPASASTSRPLEGLRVGLIAGDERFAVAAPVATTIRAQAARLAEAGATVDEITLPVPSLDAYRLWQDLVLPVIGADLPDDLYTAMVGFAGVDDSDLTVRSATALVHRWREVHRADEHRQRQRQAWADLLGTVDVVLAPCMAVPAFPHDTEREMAARTIEIDGATVPYLEVMAWAGVIGVTLLPVVALPAGRTDGGLPVGVQVIGPHLSDRWLVRVAGAMDAATPGAFALPPLPR